MTLWTIFVSFCLFFFFKQKTAYEMRISDWSSDVCSSDLALRKLILDKGRDYENSATRVSENRAAIENFWKEAASPGVTAISWARQEVQKDHSHLDRRKASIDRLITMWDRLSTHPRNTGELLNNLAIAKLEQQQALSELEPQIGKESGR